MACVGAGSNAIGIFHAFLDDEQVDLIGVEAAGEGIETGRHSASLCAGQPGVLHGSMLYLLQDEEGQVHEAHSVAAGLDYPGVGPEHSYLKDVQRVRYFSVTDQEAMAAFLKAGQDRRHHPGLGKRPCLGVCGKNSTRHAP